MRFTFILNYDDIYHIMNANHTLYVYMLNFNRQIIFFITLTILVGCSDMGEPVILQPDVDIDASSLDFGQVSVGHLQSRSLSIVNQGEGVLSGDLVLDQDSSAFSLLSSPTLTVQTLDTVEVEVGFAPSAASTYSGTITLVSNDPDEPEIIITLSGNRSTTPVSGMSLSKTSIAFGSIISGGSADESFSISSIGTDTLQLDSIRVGNTAFSTDAATPIKLAPGHSITVTVTFQPASSGEFSTQLEIYSNSTPSPEHLSLSGSASSAVSYISSVQPVWDANCSGCHGTNGGLNLSSYTQLMMGGNSGAAVTPGDGDNSLIIQRLRGIGGSRMPLSAPAVPDATIETIETWIDQGALNN